MPKGGPVDKTPPRLLSVLPDSGTVGWSGQKVLSFRFSEKMDRAPAQSWLRTYPEWEIRKTEWKRATTAEVEFFDPLPADTVIVIEILPGMSDSHRVKNETSRRFPLATGDSLDTGILEGSLVAADTALDGAVVELYPLEPDTLEYYQRPIVRRTVTDAAGRYRFEWLPRPAGPYLLRAYADTDHNLRAGEREAQRLLPDTLRVGSDATGVDAGQLTLYAWNAPGTLRAGAFEAPRWTAPIGAFALSVSESDTGWSPEPLTGQRDALGWLDPVTGGSIEEAPAGGNRVVVFVDLDADSTFSAIPDTLYGGVAPGSADTLTWFLEPWGLAENIDLEPGMEATFAVPSLGDSLVAWAAPPVPTLADTLTAAVLDSLNGLATDPPAGEKK